ncbi:integral membrane sensor signal transduction histidine kinase [Caldicellulosiruptor saccharolyticus DSM 8903]|uniref:histidine kinase n=1 Tax=Caldicellulosiruptor saccharolyticus (strain ATCC 43494 / DSM 8903 / Tp8T 6331) TaxID=351627 RepID=A4XMX5_CALS8|nr:histidine kinase [Caldicellulosiruptor saccharolyticus]ABP68260.1 integral membrane sensor signal transduction histidine kinase [Caldicellulosiruptor saccharolyticus DSM 8903]
MNLVTKVICKFSAKLRERLLAGLDNLSVRKKLLLVYILCVLIPTIVTHFIFTLFIVKNLQQQKIDQIKGVFNILNANIKKVLEEAILYSNTLYTDELLNDMLDIGYRGLEDFYSNYEGYLRNRIYQGRNVYSNIARVTIYTNNPTIVDSDGYRKFNDGEAKEWFSLVMDNQQGIIVIPTVDEGVNGEEGYVSLFRNLNQFERRSTSRGNNSKYLKIAKIDMYLSSFFNSINFEIFGGEIYLLDKSNRIIAARSNNSVIFAKPFIKFDKRKFVSKDSYIFEEKLDYNLLSSWKLVGVFSKSYMLREIYRAIEYILFISVLSLLFATLLIRMITSSLSARLELLTRHIKKIRKQNFEILNCKEGNDEIGNVIKEFNNMTIKLKELIEKEMLSEIQRKTLEIEKKQAELNALQSQINPHFLFNTLDSIRMRSVLKNELETAEIIKYLTRTLRRLIYWGNDITTVEEEIGFVEDFLKIQKYRLGEKLAYRIYVDEVARNCLIPKMTIQPLVENACIHGIEEIEGNGEIIIEVKKEEAYLIIKVEDNGIGMDEEKLSQLYENLSNNTYEKNIGLKNVYKRLMLYYNNAVDFKIHSNFKQGTRVVIKIPLELPAFVYKI